MSQKPAPSRSLTFTGRVRSFGYALRGIADMLRSQQNAWLHAAATAVVCGLGLLLGLSRVEWSLVVLSIVTVWTAEALNTAIELLTDVASPGFDPLAARAKDVAAGAVLIASLGAAGVGVLVLGPRLLLVVMGG
jgi:diacylglycerol kinase (ATP)